MNGNNFAHIHGIENIILFLYQNTEPKLFAEDKTDVG